MKLINPEDWPAEYPFAAQDKAVYFYDEVDKFFFFTGSGKRLRLPQMGKKWSDEFIDHPWMMPVEKGTLVDVQYNQN